MQIKATSTKPPLDQDSRLQSLLVKALGSIVPVYHVQQQRRERERRKRLEESRCAYCLRALPKRPIVRIIGGHICTSCAEDWGFTYYN